MRRGKNWSRKGCELPLFRLPNRSLLRVIFQWNLLTFNQAMPTISTSLCIYTAFKLDCPGRRAAPVLPYLAAASSVYSGSQTAPPLCLRARLSTLRRHTDSKSFYVNSFGHLFEDWQRADQCASLRPQCRCDAMPDNFEFESYFSVNSFHGFLFSSHCTN